MRLKKYTEQQLRKAIADSLSLRQSLKKLGVSEAGGNYAVIKKAIAFFEIDTSHFLGQGHLKGKTHQHNTRTLEEVLVIGKVENTFRLKNRILDEGLRERKCENCDLSQWMKSPIPLELHHKDGNTKNNQISNLALLCPNCHALTDNYRGKNRKCRDLMEAI